MKWLEWHLSGSASRWHGGCGDGNAGAKLSEAQALRVLSDARSTADIAADYGVSKSAISSLKSGRSWAYLQRRLDKPIERGES